MLRVASLVLIPGLFVWTMLFDHHTQVTAFFTSFEIMLDWISVSAEYSPTNYIMYTTATNPLCVSLCGVCNRSDVLVLSFRWSDMYCGTLCTFCF